MLQLLFLLVILWGLAIQEWNLFLETQRHQQQLNKVRAGNTVTAVYTSVLLSAVEMSCTTQTALALAGSPLSAIIHTHMHVACILAAATIQGWYLFH